MKSFAPALLLTLIVGCSTQPAVRVAHHSATPPVEPMDAIRSGEVVRPYHLGRYVDPNHSTLMHEGHPFYRLEASAHWNLRPGSGGGSTLNILTSPRDVAYVQPQTNDVILAELSRQREATQRIMWEAFQLAGMYDQIKKAMEDMSEVAKNHLWMRTRLANAEQQMKEMTLELEKVSHSVLPAAGPKVPPTMPTPGIPSR
jgi:hypothetical protein